MSVTVVSAIGCGIAVLLALALLCSLVDEFHRWRRGGGAMKRK